MVPVVGEPTVEEPVWDATPLVVSVHVVLTVIPELLLCGPSDVFHEIVGGVVSTLIAPELQLSLIFPLLSPPVFLFL